MINLIKLAQFQEVELLTQNMAPHVLTVLHVFSQFSRHEVFEGSKISLQLGSLHHWIVSIKAHFVC